MENSACLLRKLNYSKKIDNIKNRKHIFGKNRSWQMYNIKGNELPIQFAALK